MTVLGDDPDRAERGRRAQDRADIMRVGDLVEHQQDGASGGLAQQAVEPDIVERLDLDHHALVRRIVGNQPAKIGRLGERYGHIRRKLHEPAASRVVHARKILRSGLSSAAETACLPHSRGRWAVPWLWCDFLRRDIARPCHQRLAGAIAGGSGRLRSRLRSPVGAVGAPGTDEDDQQDRIAPQHCCGSIGAGQQV